MATAIHTTRAGRSTGVGRGPRLRRRARAAPDSRLVAELRQGDCEAFETIYDRYAPRMLAFCRHMLGSAAEAEDAVQETFASAYRSLLTGDRELELRPWLYAIARNRCVSMLRSRRPADELPELGDERDSLPELAARREDLRALVGDVRRLPEEQRAALLLAELADMPHRDLAQALGCRPEKVKALVFQARSALLADRDARAVACRDVRTAVAAADMGGPGRTAYRRHLRLCSGCGEFAHSVKRQKALLAVALPVVPDMALKARTLAGAFGGLPGGAGTAATTAGTSATGAALAGAGKGLLVKALVAVAFAAAAGAGTAAVAVHQHRHHSGGSALPGAEVQALGHHMANALTTSRDRSHATSRPAHPAQRAAGIDARPHRAQQTHRHAATPAAADRAATSPSGRTHEHGGGVGAYSSPSHGSGRSSGRGNGTTSTRGNGPATRGADHANRGSGHSSSSGNATRGNDGTRATHNSSSNTSNRGGNGSAAHPSNPHAANQPPPAQRGSPAAAAPGQTLHAPVAVGNLSHTASGRSRAAG